VKYSCYLKKDKNLSERDNCLNVISILRWLLKFNAKLIAPNIATNNIRPANKKADKKELYKVCPKTSILVILSKIKTESEKYLPDQKFHEVKLFSKIRNN